MLPPPCDIAVPLLPLVLLLLLLLFCLIPNEFRKEFKPEPLLRLPCEAVIVVAVALFVIPKAAVVADARPLLLPVPVLELFADDDTGVVAVVAEFPAE